MGGANASCYTGVLGGDLAVLAGAVICIAVLRDRKDAGDVCLAGVLRVADGGGANASCYTGALDKNREVLAGADICIAVAVDRKDASVVYLSGMLRNHRSVGLGNCAGSIGR